MRELLRSAVLWLAALLVAMSAGILAEDGLAGGAAPRPTAAVAVPPLASPSAVADLLVVATADALVRADTNGVADIYVQDPASGRFERVSVGADGAPANAPSSDPVLSADGRYVRFRSTATNLVAGDRNGVADVFRHDLRTGRTVLVTRPGAEST